MKKQSLVPGLNKVSLHMPKVKITKDVQAILYALLIIFSVSILAIFLYNPIDNPSNNSDKDSDRDINTVVQPEILEVENPLEISLNNKTLVLKNDWYVVSKVSSGTNYKIQCDPKCIIYEVTNGKETLYISTSNINETLPIENKSETIEINSKQFTKSYSTTEVIDDNGVVTETIKSTLQLSAFIDNGFYITTGYLGLNIKDNSYVSVVQNFLESSQLN